MQRKYFRAVGRWRIERGNVSVRSQQRKQSSRRIQAEVGTGSYVRIGPERSESAVLLAPCIVAVERLLLLLLLLTRAAATTVVI
jgi:hypothetical protein